MGAGGRVSEEERKRGTCMGTILGHLVSCPQTFAESTGVLLGSDVSSLREDHEGQNLYFTVLSVNS